MKKLLITGGSGFVGGHVAVKARSNWKVYATYQTYPFSISLVQTVLLKLEDAESILDIIHRIRPDVVVHCAAWSDLDQCEQNGERAFRINVDSTAVLAQACADSNIRLIFTSSDMVFDGEKGNYAESDPTFPINVYGKTKLLAEQKIQSICSNYVIARVALVYGKPITRGNSFSEKILNRFRESKSMSLFVDQFRTPVWVQTLSEALIELAEHDFTGIINLGGSERVNRYTFGLRLAEIGRYPSTLCKSTCMSEMKPTAPRPKDVSLNISLAKKILKIPFVGCRQGLSFDYSVDRNGTV